MQNISYHSYCRTTQYFDRELTEKLDKTVTELEALNINYPFNKPVPEELKNAL
jgi:hypothetical protein